MISDIPITKDTVFDYAYVSGEQLKNKPVGIVIDFHGLNGGVSFIDGTDSFVVDLAAKDIIYVFPYYGPWSWMNDVAVKTVDAIVDALFEKYALPENTPIVHVGGSMGGLSALIYTRYAKRTAAACVANCPVCDLPYHFTERPDLPRTIWNALAHYNCSFADAMRSISPLHQAEDMPYIPFTVFHNTADKSVNKQKHSDPFIAKMRESGHDVQYFIGEGYRHCDLSPALRTEYYNAIYKAILR